MSSPESDIERRERVQAALKAFTDTPMAKAATQLLNVLGYASGKTADLGDNAEALLSSIERFKPDLDPIDRNKVQAERWKDANWQTMGLSCMNTERSSNLSTARSADTYAMPGIAGSCRPLYKSCAMRSGDGYGACRGGGIRDHRL